MGLLPWVLLVAMLGFQALVALMVSASAEDAARAAARAAARGENPTASAESAVPGWLEDRVDTVTVERNGSLATASVELSVPMVVSGFSGTSATAAATFAREGGR